MNILVLDNDPMLAARFHTDDQVGSALIGLTNVLSQVHHFNPHKNNYKQIRDKIVPPALATNKFVDWVAEHVDNYMWVLALAEELLLEYQNRFNTVHRLQPTLEILIRYLPKLPCQDKPPDDFLSVYRNTPFVICNMPASCVERIENSMIVTRDGKLLTNTIENDRYFINVVESYRNFYFFKKRQNAMWYGGSWQPEWFKQRLNEQKI